MVLNQAKLGRNYDENSRRCTKQSICFRCLGEIGNLRCRLCGIIIHQPGTGIEPWFIARTHGFCTLRSLRKPLRPLRLGVLVLLQGMQRVAQSSQRKKRPFSIHLLYTISGFSVSPRNTTPSLMPNKFRTPDGGNSTPLPGNGTGYCPKPLALQPPSGQSWPHAG